MYIYTYQFDISFSQSSYLLIYIPINILSTYILSTLFTYGTYLPITFLPTYPPIYLSTYLQYLPTFLPLSTYQSTYLSINIPTYLPFCLPTYLTNY